MREKMCRPVIQAGRVISLPVSIIKPNPDQPRRRFDPQALDQLTESIRRFGVIQPLTVRRQNGVYELVAGERRLRAARLAGHKTVPCIVSTASAELSPVLALIENIQRQDLNFFEEAEAFAKLLAEGDMTQEQLAARLGLSQSAVANKLRLLRLPEEARALILSGGLTERHARALLRLPDEASQNHILCEMLRLSLSVADSERLIEEYLAGGGAKPERPQRRRLFKDVRIFVNTINHALSVMRDSGIDATSSRSENEQYIEYHIRIPKGAPLPEKAG